MVTNARDDASTHNKETFKALLVSLRDRDDPIAEQERRCFQSAAGLETVEIAYAVDERLGRRELESDLLFFGGSGAYSVLDRHSWIRGLHDFLLLVPQSGVPAWASCFAFQGLALAMGGKVVRDESRQQLGVATVELTPAGERDPLLGCLPPRFDAQFGHHDHVDALPGGMTALALGNGGNPQAYRVDGSMFWGAQFHPELNKRTTLERWRHYRKFYQGSRGEEIDRQLESSPETPEPEKALHALVDLARERRR